jgi:hypothetical protein
VRQALETIATWPIPKFEANGEDEEKKGVLLSPTAIMVKDRYYAKLYL